jgi:hypothetical protein
MLFSTFFCCFIWSSLMIRPVGMLDSIVFLGKFRGHWHGCSFLPGRLGRCYRYPGPWLHLPFRGHWPYWSSSNNSSCSRMNDWQLSTYPRVTDTCSAFTLHGVKASFWALYMPVCSGQSVCHSFVTFVLCLCISVSCLFLVCVCVCVCVVCQFLCVCVWVCVCVYVVSPWYSVYTFHINIDIPVKIIRFLNPHGQHTLHTNLNQSNTKVDLAENLKDNCCTLTWILHWITSPCSALNCLSLSICNWGELENS